MYQFLIKGSHKPVFGLQNCYGKVINVSITCNVKWYICRGGGLMQFDWKTGEAGEADGYRYSSASQKSFYL